MEGRNTGSNMVGEIKLNAPTPSYSLAFDENHQRRSSKINIILYTLS